MTITPIPIRAIVVADNQATTLWPSEADAAIAIASGALAPEGAYLHVDYISEVLLGYRDQLNEAGGSEALSQAMTVLAGFFQSAVDQ